MRLLIEGCSYSRVAFTNFGPIPHNVLQKNYSTEDWFMKTLLRVFNIRSSKKLLCCSRTKSRLSSAIILSRTSECALLLIVTTPTYQLTSRMRAATIRGRLVFLLLSSRCSHYSGCGFYSIRNKYGNRDCKNIGRF